MSNWQDLGCSPPYALFVIAKNISLEEINKKLEQAYDDEGVVLGTFYLVTSREYPNLQPTNDWSEIGTLPPITEFTSPFAGNSISDVADWLQDAPASTFLERKDFAVLDDNSEGNNTITICRYIDGSRAKIEDDEGNIQIYPCEAERGALSMWSGTYSSYFDDALDRYQCGVRATGKPDLSRGKPYKHMAWEPADE